MRRVREMKIQVTYNPALFTLFGIGPEEKPSHYNLKGIGERRSGSSANIGNNPYQVREMKQVQEFPPQESCKQNELWNKP